MNQRKHRNQWAFLYGLFVCSALLFVSCQPQPSSPSVFDLLDAKASGIDFVNEIIEDDSFNMYAFMNIYTGGGVAVGDVNNDGLEDLFFSGNRVPSRLYLNQGNLQFEDATHAAGIQTDRWCAGASMIDINQDGWLDIYVSVTGKANTANLLYVNQGNGRFEEQAAAYGLADQRQCMHSSFFDYDRDGDLDAYLIVNPVNYSLADVNRIRTRKLKGEDASTDVLYRNNGDGTFTDVSTAAGILVEGYSLGLATADINNDGWPDIYVSNDFITNDILYINNQDGTFSNRAAEQLNHTSFAGMGNDVSDFNNDGWPDIMVADMLPEDNLRKKMIIPSASYDKFQLTLEKGYEPQYTRNTLQLNNGDGTFSEMGQLAGVDKTDWSWSSLFADYDNDGDKDLLVTNGFLRDVGNLDYISYQRKIASPFGTKEVSRQKRLQAIQELGAAKLQNYLFANNNDLTFENQSDQWGLSEQTCSNGAAYADLDLDGDLELIINNVNDRAFVYENKSNESAAHFLRIQLEGASLNKQGIGASIRLWANGQLQYYQHHLYRGYESSMSQYIHFGLGDATQIDSLRIEWPDGVSEIKRAIKVDQQLQLKHADARPASPKTPHRPQALFTPVDPSKGLHFKHQENAFVDFKVQPLLPHKHSQAGPGMAVGDVNGDGLEDVFVGGAAGYAGQLFLQNEQAEFTQQPIELNAESEDMGCLFFDVEGDGDLDLYIVSGGSSFPKFTKNYQDRLYLNNGEGAFSLASDALPKMWTSGSCVSACDYDQDGDLDLFVGGRLVPGAYPTAARSYLLRNDSKAGSAIQFSDVSQAVLPDLEKAGLVTSALWTDYDKDGWTDLMLAGEWMPLTFYKNNKGQFSKAAVEGLAYSFGWWNSLQGADFDLDGDIDYVATNLGLNSHLKSSVEQPVCIYAKDYDKNGRVDPILCYYIKGTNYVAHPRDQLINQINAMRVRFKTYEAYASVDFDHAFMEQELEDAYVVKSEIFAHQYIENKGDGLFEMRALPSVTQMAPGFGLLAGDWDGDAYPDMLLVGNSYATEVGQGRYDAGKGYLLKGDGQGNFEHQKHSGFLVDGDAKSLVRIQAADQSKLFLIGRNSDENRTYQLSTKNEKNWIKLQTNDRVAEVTLENGTVYRKELYYGSGYLSQSSRSLLVPHQATSLTIWDMQGQSRVLPIQK